MAHNRVHTYTCDEQLQCGLEMLDERGQRLDWTPIEGDPNPGGQIIRGPAVAPDGRRAFTVPRDGEPSQVLVDGVVVFEAPVAGSSPAWSPDGRWLVVPALDGIHFLDTHGDAAPIALEIQGAQGAYPRHLLLEVTDNRLLTGEASTARTSPRACPITADLTHRAIPGSRGRLLRCLSEPTRWNSRARRLPSASTTPFGWKAVRKLRGDVSRGFSRVLQNRTESWRVRQVMGISPRTCGQDNAVTVAWPDDFVALYQESYRPLVRLAYLMLGSRAEAEEAVQDAVLAVHRPVGEVADPGPYLRRAVVNRAIGILRRRTVADRHVPDPPPEEQPAHLVELRDLLLSLPERQRAAIVLRYVEDVPDRDIAVTLGCREATVRSLVARGLKTLRAEV